MLKTGGTDVLGVRAETGAEEARAVQVGAGDVGGLRARVLGVTVLELGVVVLRVGVLGADVGVLGMAVLGLEGVVGVIKMVGVGALELGVLVVTGMEAGILEALMMLRLRSEEGSFNFNTILELVY